MKASTQSPGLELLGVYSLIQSVIQQPSPNLAPSRVDSKEEELRLSGKSPLCNKLQNPSGSTP